MTNATSIDFARHNEEVRRVWESYNAGRPIRVPFGRLTLEPRMWIQDPSLNSEGITWKACFDDPDVMFTTYLTWSHYVVHNMPHDIEMGIPKKHWEVTVWFSRVGDFASFGCPVHYPDNELPLTTPCYTGKNKEAIFEHGIPGPFDGFFGKIREFHEHFVDKARNYEFCGRPVTVNPPNPTDPVGQLTVALGVCGPELLADMLVNEDYYHRVMNLITDATIEQVRAWRAYLGQDPMPRSIAFADDAIQHVSLRTYREKVLPYHRKVLAALAQGGPHSIHLCGNVQRHLPTLVKELNIKSFDTGYPIDFATLRDEVGEDVEIQGGVPVANLLADTPQQVYARAAAILRSGIMRGGKFILKEANNITPMMPLQNLSAMYQAAKEAGVYEY